MPKFEAAPKEKMSRSGQFCPKCGKTKGEFVGLFCKECFLKDHPDLVHMPDKLELEFCSRCQKVRIEGKWVVQNEDTFTHWIAKKVNIRKLNKPEVRISLIPKEDATSDIEAHIEGEMEGQLIVFTLSSKLLPRKSICNDDMLVSSNYYEGIIQIRFAEKTPEKIRQVQKDIEEAMKPLQKTDSKAVVTTWEMQTFGIDAWVVSRKAAKAAAIFVSRKYKGTVKVTSKLIGLSEKGKQEHRLTYLVMIP